MRGGVAYEAHVLHEELPQLVVATNVSARKLPGARRRYRSAFAEPGVIRAEHYGTGAGPYGSVSFSGDGAAVAIPGVRNHHHASFGPGNALTRRVQKTTHVTSEGVGVSRVEPTGHCGEANFASGAHVGHSVCSHTEEKLSKPRKSGPPGTPDTAEH